MIIVSVALQVPLRKTFDYSAGKNDLEKLKPGVRVYVPFGKQKHKVGILVETKNSSQIAREKIKPISSVLDETPVLSEAELKMVHWSADYYQHPIGEVLFNALPVSLRQGKEAKIVNPVLWQLTKQGAVYNSELLKTAPKQRAILEFLLSKAAPVTAENIREKFSTPLPVLQALEKKCLIEKTVSVSQESKAIDDNVSLNDDQIFACDSIAKSIGRHQVFLLDGVTGSGKTEVYIELIKKVVKSGKQVLILSPEIGLTPQLIERIQNRVSARMAVLHSGLSSSERMQAWLQARNGTADIILGTRSAIWTPLLKPGLFIVDEEHDVSYKQQDGFKYSARDLAIIRSSFTSCPVILGSATPSMESLNNVEARKYHLLRLDKRAGSAEQADIEIIDLRNKAMEGAFSQVMLSAIEKELSHRKQVLLFLNRRGYAPAFMCHHCGWIAKCDRCESNMTFHKSRGILSCHHCGRQESSRRNCPGCEMNDFIEIGHGTERLSETLTKCFPKAKILRIDRDSTRRKGSMEDMLDLIKAGDADILIGTQMLAKGHHFPALTLVGIVDIDGGLCSTDFRASERMAQLFVQVSGRAGREKSQGKVLLQTHFPDHPLLNSLIKKGYRSFADELLKERKLTVLPPFSFLALFRSEGIKQESQLKFLEKVRNLLKTDNQQFQIYGPYPAPIEKRAGKIRMQLLVMSESRSILNKILKKNTAAIEGLPETRKIRWSLDIDPQDMM
ncbi:MAG: primosomal protein N' [Gammaproteobacteria bacterium]|nr:primosomal protein N' [Gammaproteobacteria bacterium]